VPTGLRAAFVQEIPTMSRKPFRFVAALATLAVSATMVAADLTKIDRRIAPVEGISLLSAQGERHLQKPEPKDGKDLDWKTVIVSKEEPGEPLIISGVIYGPDGKTPVEGATVYVYHTDAKGYYNQENQKGPPRLQGHMRTNSSGKYEYRTIRPAGYPNARIPQHIHYEIATPGYQKEVTEIFFADDTRLTNEDRAAAKKKNGPPIVTLQRGKDGVLRGVADFSLSRTKGSSSPKGDR
jgi:protocatechuate 3,4-dioxygenase beta subunit